MVVKSLPIVSSVASYCPWREPLCVASIRRSRCIEVPSIPLRIKHYLGRRQPREIIQTWISRTLAKLHRWFVPLIYLYAATFSRYPITLTLKGDLLSLLLKALHILRPCQLLKLTSIPLILKISKMKVQIHVAVLLLVLYWIFVTMARIFMDGVRPTTAK